MSKTIWGAIGAMKVLANNHEIANVTSVTISDVEVPTAEIGGAGVMGKFSMPIPGQVNPMTASVSVRAAGADKKYLSAPTVDLEIRMAANCRSSDGTIYVAGTKIYLKGYSTKMTGGKGEPGSTRDESYDYAVVRYREVVDGEETVLVDQIANVYRVGGVDRMSGINQILG